MPAPLSDRPQRDRLRKALHALPCAALLACVAGDLQAQSLPFEVQSDGRFALGYSDRTPGAEAFLVGDGTLRLRFATTGSSLPLGVEIGLFGRADALDTPHETYGAITYDLPGGGRLLAGVPRPAYDGFAVSAMALHFPSLDVDRVGDTRSEATSGAMFFNYLPLGLRFQNEAGALRYAVSAHRADAVDRTIASLGLSQRFGDLTVEGALEAGFGAKTDLGGKLQLSGQIGAVSGGLGLYAPASGVAMIEGFASLTPTARISLSGVLQLTMDSAIDPTLGVSARYHARKDLGVTLGVLSETGADLSVSACLDWSF